MSPLISSQVPLHVDARGQGMAVVLGHGFGGSSRNFRPQLRVLQADYRAVAFDARGHARSGAPEEPGAYSLPSFVSDLGGVLNAEGGGAGVVGGLSMGAAVALHFALLQPQAVRGLVLASYPASRRRGGFASIAEPFAAAIEREGLDAAGARFVWREGSGLGEQGAALVRQGFLEHPPHAVAAILRELLAELPELAALAPRLTSLEVPALIVAGDADLASLDSSRCLAEALPRARLQVVEGAGHVVNLEKPREFNAALLDFLTRCGSAGGAYSR